MTKRKLVKRKPPKYKFVKYQGNYQTIKVPLKLVLLDPNKSNDFREKVVRISKIQDDTLLFLNYYIKQKFANYEDVPIIDKKLIKYIFKIMGETSKEGNGINHDLLIELEPYYNSFQQITNHQKNDLFLLNNVLDNYVSVQILTNIQVNIKEYYIQRLTKYIRIFGGRIYDRTNLDQSKKKDVLKKLVDDILNYRLVDPLFRHWYETAVEDRCVPRDPMELDEQCLFYDCKVDKNWHKYLCLSMNILQSYENFNRRIDKLGLTEQKIKLFSVLPIPSFDLKFVTFDTTSLIDIFFTEGKKVARKNLKDRGKKMTNWKHFFKIDKKPMKANKKGPYEFDFMIKTDGTSCCLLFKKKGIPEETKEQTEYQVNTTKDKTPYIEQLPSHQIEEYKNLVYCDPGQKDPAYLRDKKNHKTFCYSSKQREFQIRSDKCRSILEQEKLNNPQIQLAENEMSLYCSKSIDNYNDYLRARYEHSNLLYNFYQRDDRLWEKWRQRKYINKQRSEDGFLNNIEKHYGESPLIIWGNWSRKPGMKNGGPSVGVGLKRKVEKRFDLVLIDEFRTSCLCNHCHNRLAKVYNNDGKYIHRILGCPTCYLPEQSITENNLGDNGLKYIHRDLNSVKNMETIVDHVIQEGCRPLAFQRATRLDIDEALVYELV